MTSKSVSSSHARIIIDVASAKRGIGARLIDSSLNGTFINDARVHKASHPLRSGDAIRFGYDLEVYRFFFPQHLPKDLAGNNDNNNSVQLSKQNMESSNGERSSGNVPIRGPRPIAAATTAAGMVTQDSEQAARRHRRSLSPGGEVRDARAGPAAPPFATDEIPERLPSRQDLIDRQSPSHQAGPRNVPRGTEFESKGVKEALISDLVEVDNDENSAASRIRRRRQSAGLGASNDPAGISSTKSPTAPLGTSSPNRNLSNLTNNRVVSHSQKQQVARSKSPTIISEDIQREGKHRRDSDIRSHISSLPRRLPGEEVPVELAFPSARTRSVLQEHEPPQYQPIKHDNAAPGHSKIDYRDDDNMAVNHGPYPGLRSNYEEKITQGLHRNSKRETENTSNESIRETYQRNDEERRKDIYTVDDQKQMQIHASNPVMNPRNSQLVAQDIYQSDQDLPERRDIRLNNKGPIHSQGITDVGDYQFSVPEEPKKLKSESETHSDPFQGHPNRSSSRSSSVVNPPSNQTTNSHPRANETEVPYENDQNKDYSHPVQTRRDSQRRPATDFPSRHPELSNRDKTNEKERELAQSVAESHAHELRSSVQGLNSEKQSMYEHGYDQESGKIQPIQRHLSSNKNIGAEHDVKRNFDPPLPQQHQQQQHQQQQHQQQQYQQQLDNDDRLYRQSCKRDSNVEENYPQRSRQPSEDPPRPHVHNTMQRNPSNDNRVSAPDRDERIDIASHRGSRIEGELGGAVLDDSLEVHPRIHNREVVSTAPIARVTSSQRISSDRPDLNDSQQIASDWRQLALETSSVLRNSENDSRISNGRCTGSDGRVASAPQEPFSSLRPSATDAPQCSSVSQPFDKKPYYQREIEAAPVHSLQIQQPSLVQRPSEPYSSAAFENPSYATDIAINYSATSHPTSLPADVSHVPRSNHNISHNIPSTMSQHAQPITRASFVTLPNGLLPDARGEIVTVNIATQPAVNPAALLPPTEPMLTAPGGIAWVVPQNEASIGVPVPVSATVPPSASSSALLYSEAASAHNNEQQRDSSAAPQPVRLNTELSPSHKRALSLLEDVKSEPLSPLLANKKKQSVSGKPMGTAIENLSASLSISRSLPTSPYPASANSGTSLLLNHSVLSPAAHASDPLLAEERSRMRDEVTALRSVARELRSMVEAQYLSKDVTKHDLQKLRPNSLSALLANADASGSTLLRRGISLALSNLSSICRRATVRSAFQTWYGASKIIGKEKELMKSRHFEQFRSELQGQLDQQMQEHEHEKKTLLLQLEIERLKLAESSNAPQIQMLPESTSNEFVPVLDSSVNASIPMEDGAAQTYYDTSTRRRAQNCMSPPRPVWEDPKSDGALASTAASRNRTHAAITQRVALEAAAMEEARQSLLRAPLRSKSPAALAAAMMAQATALNNSAASSGQYDDRHSAPQLLVMPSLRRSVELANAAKGLPPLSASGGGASAAASIRGRKSAVDSEKIPSRSSSAGRSQTNTLQASNVPAPALSNTNAAPRSTTSTISSTAAAATLTATGALNQSATISLLQQALNKSSAPPQPQSSLNGQSLTLRVDENGRLILVPMSNSGSGIDVAGGGGNSSPSLQSILNRGAQTSSSVINNLLPQQQQQQQGHQNQQYSTQMNELLSTVLAASTGNSDGFKNFSADANSFAAQALLFTREEQLRRLVGAADEQIIRLAVAAAGNSFNQENLETQKAPTENIDDENNPDGSNSRNGSTGVRGSFADMSGGGGKIVKSNSAKPPRVSIHERGPPMGSFQLARSKHAAGAGALYEPDLEKLAARRKTEPLGTSEATSTSLGGSAGLTFPQKRRNAGTVTEEPLLEFAGMLEDREVQRKEAAAEEAAAFDVMDPLGRFRVGDNDNRKNSSFHSGLSSAVAGSRRVMHFPEEVELNAFRQPSSSIGDGARDFGGGYATSYAFQSSDDARDFGLPGPVDIRQAMNKSDPANGLTRIFNLDDLHREGRIGALLNDGDKPGDDFVEKRALDMFRGRLSGRNSALQDPPTPKRVRGGFVGSVVLPLRPGMLSLEISQGIK
jgi:hypothetical protein